MAKKFDFDWKNFLLQKGEKVGLGIGVGVLLLMLVFGIKGVFSGSPGANAKVINDLTQAKSNLIKTNSPRDSKQFEVDQTILVASDLDAADPDKLRATASLFVPFAPEDQKRREPKILAPVELEAAFVVAQIKSYMFDPDFRKIMVLRGTDIKSNKDQMGAISNSLMRMPGGGGQRPGMGMGGMGMGGGMGGMVGNPTGPRQQQTRPRTGGGGKGLTDAGGGLERGVITGSDKDQKKDHGLVEIKELANLTDARLADRVLPRRMVIFEGSFPLKKQLEEYRSALHLASDAEAWSQLRFAGFNVERREIGPDGKPAIMADGKPSEFADFGFEEEIVKILRANGKRFDQHADEELLAVRFDGLAMRLPEQFDKSYPSAFKKNKLKQLDAALKALSSKDQVAEVPDDPRFQDATTDQIYGSGDSPTNQTGGATGVGKGGTIGVGKGGTTGVGKAGTTGVGKAGTTGVGKAGGVMQPEAGVGAAGPGKGGVGAGPDGGILGQVNANIELPEYCLVRFIDAAVEPGKTYEYRYQIRVKNPNKGLDNAVAYKKLAQTEYVASSWIEVGKRITIPTDFHFYAVDMKEVDPKRYQNFPRPNKDQAAMQLQRWVDVFDPAESRKNYPVGDWAVAEQVLVNRGEYVGGKHLIKLPVWEFFEETFVIATNPKARNQKRVFVPFTESDAQCPILVHFEGGTVSYFKPDEGKKPVEDTKVPHELLLLSPEGKLFVRNSVTDEKDEARKGHFEEWETRVTKVETDMKEKKDPKQGGNEPNSPFGAPGKGGGKQ